MLSEESSDALALCLLWVLSLTSAAYGQVKVTTVAGGAVNDAMPATSAALQFPADAAVDSKGNLYIADFYDHRIRMVSVTGTISTIAGTGISGYSGDNGPAKVAKIRYPDGVVVDSKGNIVFSDGGNNRIRQINPATGIITTIAGTGAAGFGGDGGLATAAKLKQPFGLAFDKSGNLFFADFGNQRIRRIDTTGKIGTVAGNGIAGFSGDGGKATLASLNYPHYVTFDSAGNLYISDTNNFRVRKVDTTGTITTYAGSGLQGCAGDGSLATAARLRPFGLTVRAGQLLIATGGCSRLRSVNLATNIIGTVAGSSNGYDGNGHTALASQFEGQKGVSLDKSGNPLIVDAGNAQVRKLNTGTSIVSDTAGGYAGNNIPGTMASLNAPESIAFDSAGNMYIAEIFGNRVRKLSTTGTLTTFAGTGVTGYSGDGGAATSARLYGPAGVVADKLGNVYIADNGNGVIRKVALGKISTFAKNPNFSGLYFMAADSSNNLYVADYAACVIFRITPASAVSVVAGVLNHCAYNGDGISATTAYLNSPYAVAVDSLGNLYIGDSGNNRVRKVTGGKISTVAGNGTCGYSGDGGLATSAKLCLPTGVTVDSSGNLFIGDYNNSRLRKVAAGVISTFAGTGIAGYNGDGLLATQTNLDGPAAVAVSPAGIVYIADDGQYRVRKIH